MSTICDPSPERTHPFVLTPPPPDRSGRWVGIDTWLATNEPELPDDLGSLWREGTDTSPFPVSSLHGALSPEERQDMYDRGGWGVEKVAKPRKHTCVFCGSVLDASDEPGRGRPRLVCGADDCVRQLKAQQKRRQRKRGKPRTVEGPGRYCGGSASLCTGLPAAEPNLIKVLRTPDVTDGRRHNPVLVHPHAWSFIAGFNRSGDEYATCIRLSTVIRLRDSGLTLARPEENSWRIG